MVPFPFPQSFGQSNQTLRTWLWVWGLLSSLLFWSGLAVADPPGRTLGPSQVKILHPKDGQVLRSSTVRVEFEFLRGRKDHGDHVHLILNGEKWGSVDTSPVFLKNLAPGEHIIRMEVATKDHELLGIRDEVRFRIESDQSGP